MNEFTKPYLTECPRDAIQGIHDFVPTEKKVKYLNFLLQKNLFDVIDFGSFVSQKAIPQLADTHEVVKQLELAGTKTKLLAIVANERGAADAALYDAISFVGYPFSISETFQQRNTNASINESVIRVKGIQEICHKSDKEMVLYLSMAFGNPYGDAWNEDIVTEWLEKLKHEGINRFLLSDTIGSATPTLIETLCKKIIPTHPNLSIGVHLHTKIEDAQAKIRAAADNGCTIFDGAIMGYGGCPMAADTLTGNMPTEALLTYFGMASEEELTELRAEFSSLISS